MGDAFPDGGTLVFHPLGYLPPSPLRACAARLAARRRRGRRLLRVLRGLRDPPVLRRLPAVAAPTPGPVLLALLLGDRRLARDLRRDGHVLDAQEPAERERVRAAREEHGDLVPDRHRADLPAALERLGAGGLEPREVGAR